MKKNKIKVQMFKQRYISFKKKLPVLSTSIGVNKIGTASAKKHAVYCFKVMRS